MRLPSFPAALLLLVLGLACSTPPVQPASPGDGGVSDGGDAGQPGADGGPGAGVECRGGVPSSFPTFDRACSSDQDCTIGLHQTDCCDGMAAMGIDTSEASLFAADEAICEAMFPTCDCSKAGAITTDDGSMAPAGTGASAVVVHCTSSVCTTTVRAPTACDQETCTATQVCVQDCSGVQLPPDSGPLPSQCVDVPSACAGSTSCTCYGTTDPCPTGECMSVENGAPVCVCA